MKTEDKDFYTINEFAEKLSVHPNSVRKAVKSGRISAVRLSGTERAMYRISHSELGRLVAVDIDEMINKEIEKRETQKGLC